jgi:hypothetical protein
MKCTLKIFPYQREAVYHFESVADAHAYIRKANVFPEYRYSGIKPVIIKHTARSKTLKMWKGVIDFSQSRIFTARKESA